MDELEPRVRELFVADRFEWGRVPLVEPPVEVR
jgi:hypothetical protein